MAFKCNLVEKHERRNDMEQTHITTKVAARLLGVRPDTLRRGLCVDGAYMHIKPVKLQNRRLLWPVKDIQKILGGDKK